MISVDLYIQENGHMFFQCDTEEPEHLTLYNQAADPAALPDDEANWEE